MDNNSKKKKSSLGIVSILTIIFVILKLCGVIDWSWLWVLCPIWITLLITAIAFAVILIAGRIKKGKW